MRYVANLLLALILVASASGPALAHRPYYTRVETIRLPTGEIGELRLLNGDGIFFTDPVRPLIVSSEGRLLARGPKAHSIAVSCDDNHRCLIADLWNERVYELDSGSFRQGPMQPKVTDGDRSDNWDLEDGDEAWGFTTRDATANELLQSNLALAKESLFGLVFVAIFAGLGAFAMVPIRLSIRSRPVHLLARIGLFVVGLLVFSLFSAVALWFSLLGGLTFELWLVPTALAASFVWIAAWIGKRQFRQNLPA
jgi:hypothetical protein